MLNSILFLQADAAGDAAAPAGGGYQMLIMIGVIIVVFYFFMIRPQQKKQKAETKMRESLGKGDKIITIGGVHGRIVSVDDLTALVEIDNGVKIKVEKSALKPAAAELDDKAKK